MFSTYQFVATSIGGIRKLGDSALGCTKIKWGVKRMHLHSASPSTHSFKVMLIPVSEIVLTVRAS